MDEYITPLTKSERAYIKKLIKYLDEDNWIFIVGPNGMGKSTIIGAAIEKITKSLSLDCYYFDLKEVDQGAHLFYRKIINTISKDINDINWGSNISNDFITRLDNCVTKPTLLVFDSFRAINRDFYDKFTRDCRKIFTDGRATTNLGLSNLQMIFAGSLVNSGNPETSPLWNITEKIELLSLSQEEAEEVIIFLLNKHGIDSLASDTIDFIKESTRGHRYIINEFIKFFVNENKQKKIMDHQKTLNSFVHHIWSMVNKEKGMINRGSDNLQKHFLNIVEYLATFDEILTLVLDLQDGKFPLGPKFPAIDSVTITGAISKNEEGYYSFSNTIYERFFNILLDCHRHGDICLYHPKDGNLWNRAKKVYLDLHEKGIIRKLDEPLPPGMKDLTYLTRNVVAGLRNCDSAIKFANELTDMLCLIFDLSSWGVYNVDVKGKKVIGPDINFEKEFPVGNHVSSDQLVNIEDFVKRVILQHDAMIDWTGEWFAVPVAVTEDFGRLFLAKMDPHLKRMRRPITTFVQEALSAYYYKWSKEKDEKELNNLELKLTQLRSFPSLDYRSTIAEIWTIQKSMLKTLGISEYSIYEILIDNYVIHTHSSDVKLKDRDSAVKLEDIPELDPVLREIGDEYSNYPIEKGDSYFYGATMDSGAIMLLKISTKLNKIEGIVEFINDLFDLIKYALNSKWNLYRLHLLRNALSGSQEYFYVTDKKRRVMIVNEKMEKLINATGFNDSLDIIPCYKLLMGEKEPCMDCRIEQAIESDEPIRVYRDREFCGNRMRMDCTFIPIKDKFSGKSRAVAIFIHDVSDFRKLLEAIWDMEKMETVDALEKFIFAKLNDFGFDKIFRFKHDPEKYGKFISEDYFKRSVTDEQRGKEFKAGNQIFVSVEDDLLEGRVVVWYRKKSQKVVLKSLLNDRLMNSGFSFRESQQMPEFDSRVRRPDFWVTVPIKNQRGMEKIYSMCTWDNDEKDEKILTLDKLQILETFSNAASQLIQNVRHRTYVKDHSYLKKLQAMLSHGTIESLQLMRDYLEPVINMEDRDERKEFIDKADANCDIVQNTLSSLLTIERGPDRIHKEDIEINKLLKFQLDFFLSYATESAGIDFNFNLNDGPVLIHTDKTILLQILYNIVGNSIRHLRRLKRIDIKNTIAIKVEKHPDHVNIEISDNGLGLPDIVKHFFRKPFHPGMDYPSGGLGLGFSREMAYMLRGELLLIEKDSHNFGTVLRLVLNEGG